MRKLIVVVAISTLLAGLAASPTGAGAGRVKPWVVCAGYSASGVHTSYKFRPHACGFHERGAPYANAWTLDARKLRWKYWSPRRAQGRGKTGVNMYGYAPVWVRLSRPRYVCGRTVFTRGRFKFVTHFRGRRHTYRSTYRLDRCAL